MTVKLFAFTCGWLEGISARLMEGGEGRVELPIPAYLIEHPKGIALFDTGMHPDCQHDPAGRVGAARRPNCSRSTTDQARKSVPGWRRSAGTRREIDLVINSHFHFDHVGGNALIPNATMIVQRREWEAGMDPDIAMRSAVQPRAISTSATNCSCSTASMTYLATAASSACRPMATPPATSR